MLRRSKTASTIDGSANASLPSMLSFFAKACHGKVIDPKPCIQYVAKKYFNMDDNSLQEFINQKQKVKVDNCTSIIQLTS